MREAVIVSAARTPIGRFGGALKDFKSTELGGIAIAEVVKRAGIDGATIDKVIMGQVLQGGVGQIPSRQATRAAGLPWDVPSVTVNKVCSSGIISVAMADQMIRAGDADIIVAGGMESMSQAPYFLPKSRWGARMGDFKAIDLMVHDGLWCAFYNVHMAMHGGGVAAEYGIYREEMDKWSARSQQLACEAIKAGRLKEEIVPVSIPQRKGDPKIFDTDESPRPETTYESLAKLPAVFDPKGPITAGNAPGVSDGAAAIMVMSREKAQELGLEILATIKGYGEVSADAPYIATVPGLATNKVLQKVGMTIDQIDLIENNEAFAAVPLTSGKVTGWDFDKVNVNGGAVAFGHPIGASGARILMTLIYELRRRGGGHGIATICSGAAQGDAMLIKVD